MTTPGSLHVRLVRNAAIAMAVCLGAAPLTLAPTPAIAQDAAMDDMSRDLDEAADELSREMDRLEAELGRTFERARNQIKKASRLTSQSRQLVRQSLDMRDEGDRYVVEVDVPEGDSDKVQVDLEGETLTVAYKSVSKSEKTGPGGVSVSRSVRSYQQVMTFPGPVKESGLKVDRRGDSVVVTVPKADSD